MRLLLILMLAPLSWGQFTVMFTPYSLDATQKMFANGRDAGVWKITFCADVAGTPIPAERIMMAAPAIPFMPTALAEDLLTRKADASKWQQFARYGGFGLQYGGTAATAYGVLAKAPSATTAGVAIQGGLALAQLLSTRAQARAPNPAPYYKMLLPDTVMIPTPCATFLGVSSLMKDAKVIGPIHVDTPGVPMVAPRTAVDPDQQPPLRPSTLSQAAPADYEARADFVLAVWR